MDIWERAQPRSHFVKEQLIFAEPDRVGLCGEQTHHAVDLAASVKGGLQGLPHARGLENSE
jgi:hypothetical protein